MDLVKLAITKPVMITVGVILILIFGLLGLSNMPYQLSPSVVKPEITVTTTWQGATPYEVESEIIEEQEETLKGIPGLIEMESTAYNSMGEISLKFRLGTDLDNALLRVSNKINEVPSYPQNVDKPVISATGAATSPVIWMILKPLENAETQHIDTYRTFFEDEVKQNLERVTGVADLFVFGGTETQMEISVFPEKLAAYGLTFDDVIRTIQAENQNTSAGTLGLSRKNYRIRTVAEYGSVVDIENVVLLSDGQQRVFLKDVADVALDYEINDNAMLHNGEEGIVTGVEPEPGTNVLALTDKMEAVVKGLNGGILKENGLYLDWVYDQRPYINSAIDLVKQNILIGGILAVIVLLTFLRSLTSTVIVATAIPISVIGTFMFMNFFGRNINVVSLAGISFAVGMLVDNAIVVLENIDRHRNMGKTAFKASYDGAKEVWGAVFASTTTTIAVFLPIVFLEEEAGQLFRDIAIAVTSAVIISFFVSVLVIPMLSNLILKHKKIKEKKDSKNPLVMLGKGFASLVLPLVKLCTLNWMTRIVTTIILVGFAFSSAYILMPKMEYLPEGNRNLILNIFVPPPGLSYEHRYDIGEELYEKTKPLMGQDHNGLPGVEQLFYVGADRIMITGAVSIHEDRAGELIPFFQKAITSFPGMYGVSMQASIFEQGIGEGRSINVDISGVNLQQISGAAGMMYGMISQMIPGSQIRPIPSIELTYPEVQVVPDREKLRAAGLNSSSLGTMVDVLMNGRTVGDFSREGSKKIDLVVQSANNVIETPEDIKNSLIATPAGGIVPIMSVADFQSTTGIPQIRHIERKRTTTLQVTPPKSMPIEEAMGIISQQAVPAVKSKGMLNGLEVNLSGTADKLVETKNALQWNFVLASVIIYLLMSALFGNFIYPLVIIFTIPLAASGGFIGLKLVNLTMGSQPMDILTMLGFVILIGVVVNNAILIVHQSLNNIRDHSMYYKDAVLEAVRTRLRPIYMSAFTSIFGMLPLVISTGSGSELYRGLGSVVLGGLALSTVLTIFLIPSLLMFVIKFEKTDKEEENA
ncbi:efflux RND transporter permease subunit [Limisalsivibrio acetivorans]|uniref:efflux RND transporter permease subunit n=1 Tax=Limisalsivibrio acetivorans TaxID=1304888 RepID=UPI0003B4D026|nr:efflux RND transporter permease subunit [Limisalsivibrio acetivorans]